MTLGLVGRRPERVHEWWPVDTVLSADDILVAGTSLRSLAESSGTPVVCGDERVEVLVVRVVAAAAHRTGYPVLQVDARLENLRLIWSETRRIGAGAFERQRTVLVVRAPSRIDLEDADDVIAVTLPTNVGVGDLLAIPSRPLAVDAHDPGHPLTGRTSGMPDSIFASAS